MTVHPRIDFPLLKRVIGKHALIFGLMLGLGAMFACVGGTVIYFNDDLPSRIGGGLFLLLGVGVMGLACVTNISSISHYYSRGMLRKHGVDVVGSITGKRCEDAIVYNRPTESTKVAVGADRNLWVDYAYRYGGHDYAGAFACEDPTLFAALQLEQHVPLRVLRHEPAVSHPRLRKLRHQTTRRTVVTLPNNVTLGEDLVTLEEP